MAVFGLTLAMTKLYVGKKYREIVSGISDLDFYTGHNNPFEESWSTWQSYVGRLVRCPACTGFWVGCLMAIIYWFDFPNSEWTSFEMWRSTVYYALGASAFSLSGWFVLDRLEMK